VEDTYDKMNPAVMEKAWAMVMTVIQELDK
jgi:hypothetical protein